MGLGSQLNDGLFAGTDAAICEVLGLENARQLGQRSTYRTITGRPVPINTLVDLVRGLHRKISANLRERQPSAENWRWKLQTYIAEINNSPEVVLERAIAILAERGHLSEWCNQIPVASGLVSHKSDKRAAVDLARIVGDRLDLFELKWESDTPIYAAFEIVLYGLAYILCRSNRTKLGYADLETMKVNALGLNVLAPLDYHEGLDLGWLQMGLDAGIRTVSQEQLGPGFQASFRFMALPMGPAKPFASGADAVVACGATPLPPSARALVQAMSNLAPVCPAAGAT